jgi:carbon monoxide dehydrogenase subunit G
MRGAVLVREPLVVREPIVVPDLGFLKNIFGRVLRLPDGREGTCNVLALLRDVRTGLLRAVPGCNIVTNDGDQYYAEAAVGTPSWSVAGMRLGTDNTTPTKTDTDVTTFLAGSGKAIDGTYPQTDDGDADNTGAGVDIVTWRVSYGTSEGNGTGIIELAIVDNITTPTKALTHALFGASFNKTSSDTLKVFANHTFNGV